MSDETQGRIALGKRYLDEHAPAVKRGALVAVVLSVLASLSFCWWPEVRARFLATYLVGVTFLLSISLGALWFVILQHLVKAGWSVVIRRLAENLAINLVWLPILLLPVPAAMFAGAELYPWQDWHGGGHGGHAAAHEDAHDASHAEESHGEESHDDASHEEESHGMVPGAVGQTQAGLTEAGHDGHGAGAPDGAPLTHYGLAATGAHHLDDAKAWWLSPTMFVARLAIYFAIWIGMAWWYRKNSLEQDQTGDVSLTKSMEFFAPIGMLLFALSVSLAGMDLLMSLEPFWYSTMFGVYFFAGCVVSFFAAMLVYSYLLQRQGLAKEISVEHFHDMGKFMFAFVVFWAYVSFSQYMLIWYGNLPEETIWFEERLTGHWTGVSIWLLLGHFVIPFLGIMSRHVKRRPAVIALAAVWVLAMHYCDLFWIALPSTTGGSFPVPLLDMAIMLGMGAVYVANTVIFSAGRSLIPEADPRLGESLAFENY